jgi:hypothetical protein
MVSVPEQELQQRTSKEEFFCMQASCFDNASEIFRRRSERDFGADMSARARKQQQFRSAIFESMDKGAAPAAPATSRASRAPQGSGRNSESSASNFETTRPKTARARLQHITMNKRAEGLY